MRVEFKVQGSGKDPYLVSFWIEENQCKSQCSCPAGRFKGKICKHRTAIFNGDITNLQSDNLEDFDKLKEIIAIDSSLYCDYQQAEQERLRKQAHKSFLLTFVDAVPNVRRRRIDVFIAKETIKSGGFGKTGTYNFFDFYTADRYYVGSVKKISGDFRNNLNDVFSDVVLVTRIMKHELYIAELNSIIGVALIDR